MSVSYYSVRGGFETKLVLNNKGMKVLTPRLSLYARDGRRHVTDLTIGPRTLLEVDVRTLATEAGEGFEDGSLRVTYTGVLMELGGLLRMTNAEAGTELDEQLMYPYATRSNQLEAVWTVPSATASARLVVTNSTGAAVDAKIAFSQSPKRRPETVRLGPWQLQVIDLLDDEKRPGDSAGPTKANVGAISIEYTGSPGAVLARGLISDSSVGYSAVIPFVDPAEAKSSRLYSGGVRVAPIGKSNMQPLIVAHNISGAPVRLTGRLQVTNSAGKTTAIELPGGHLGPDATAVIDAGQAWREAGSLALEPTVGLEFEYSSVPGSVIISAASVSDDLQHVFRIPLVDQSAMPSSTGNYYWRSEGTRSTVVYIQNVTDRPQLYNFLIRHPMGLWSRSLQKLGPRETTVIDVGHLRAAQVPDRKGRTIPLSVSGGQIDWSLVGSNEPLALLGRVEQVDLPGGVSSTYACPMIQNHIFESASITPNYHWVYSGYDEGFSVIEQDRDGISNELEEAFGISDQLSWSSSNTNVAYKNIYYPGYFWGQNEGLVQVFASGQSVGIRDIEDPETHADINEYADIEVVAPVPYNIQLSAANAFNGRTNGQTDDALAAILADYTWESSTGYQSDLWACQVWEQLSYGTWDSPPFHGQPSSGQLFMKNATDSGMTDIHGTAIPMWTDGNFQPVAGTGPLFQTYHYRCTTVAGNALQLFEDGDASGGFSIDRAVTVNGSNWAFSVSKHGTTAQCSLRTTNPWLGRCQ